MCTQNNIIYVLGRLHQTFDIKLGPQHCHTIIYFEKLETCFNHNVSVHLFTVGCYMEIN